VGFTALSGPSSQDELVGVPEKFLLIGVWDEVQVVYAELDGISNDERLALRLVSLSFPLQLRVVLVYFPFDGCWRLGYLRGLAEWILVFRSPWEAGPSWNAPDCFQFFEPFLPVLCLLIP
jgi:hypothetical protein